MTYIQRYFYIPWGISASDGESVATFWRNKAQQPGLSTCLQKCQNCFWSIQYPLVLPNREEAPYYDSSTCLEFQMLSEKHWSIWVLLGLFSASGYSVSAACVVALCVVQLCSAQCFCLVTACWAGGRNKCCRCVWGNLWRAFEEGVSHSSWSSSRTESWNSHLLRSFFPSQYLALSDIKHRQTDREH